MVEGPQSQLVDVAERLAATRGFGAMTLREVQLRSGQRNKSVVQYHFGSREGLIGAVMDARMGPINARRLVVLEEMGEGADLRGLVEALVLPLAEVTVLVPGSYWARFLLQGSFDPTLRDLVRGSFSASSFRSVRSALISRLDEVPPAGRRHRVDRMVEFVLVVLAGAEEARENGRMRPATAGDFVVDLVDMCCGMLTAPASWAASGVGPGPERDEPARNRRR